MPPQISSVKCQSTMPWKIEGFLELSYAQMDITLHLCWRRSFGLLPFCFPTTKMIWDIVRSLYQTIVAMLLENLLSFQHHKQYNLKGNNIQQLIQLLLIDGILISTQQSICTQSIQTISHALFATCIRVIIACCCWWNACEWSSDSHVQLVMACEASICSIAHRQFEITWFVT